MRIEKVLNNNVVISLDASGKDVIVMGSGIAFQKKRGDIIDQKKIERIFTQNDSDLASKIQSALKDIPIEYLEFTEQMIHYAQNELDTKFNDNLYLSLMDHIYFTIKRYHENMLIQNRLLFETKLMYPEEFRVGNEIVQKMNKMFKVDLPEDEAAFIALHFVNANLGTDNPSSKTQDKIVQDMLTIIKNYFKLSINSDTLQYVRLVTHLKFFAQRITQKKMQATSGGDVQLFSVVKERYSISYECVQRISQYLQIEYGYNISDEEKLYLTIHIERIRELNA
ncbi:BglG family transcription antiterminator LicT [Holdemanella biformis]|uniref:BglG family transcription antiterminator LicT n=1 Tax=Holdemanella biformis TaxID=1735 RepID=UPI00266D57FD|nr:PRD domain-containing protein [Holdemanella biformis]